MSANDRAVDHKVLIVAIGRQRLEDTFPHIGMAPATEVLMHSLPLAIAFRQVTPMCTRTQDPEATVDEHPVVSAGPTGTASPARKQRRDLRRPCLTPSSLHRRKRL